MSRRKKRRQPLTDATLRIIRNIPRPANQSPWQAIFSEQGLKIIKGKIIEADEEGITFEPGDEPEDPSGTYLVTQSVVQHNGTLGNGFRIANLMTDGPIFDAEEEYVDQDLPKDMVTARPSEVTIIRAKFDKPGRYVWHCHILSHEDHEMMRVLYVGDGTAEQMSGHPAPPA